MIKVAHTFCPSSIWNILLYFLGIDYLCFSRLTGGSSEDLLGLIYSDSINKKEI